MLENLIYSQKKSLLTKQLEAGNVPENAIAFIGDTKLIYTLGLYFGGGYTKEEIDSMLSVSKYEFVDLGLPSGLKWASCNVGATKPEEYGLYFAWGEPDGYSGITNEKQFSWADYKLCGGSSSTLTKYNSTVDNLTTLELSDDAAYQSDNTCRMPTKADFEELTANTTSTWETLNGVEGRRFTSNTNGNSIFIPAAGYCGDGSVSGVGSGGRLWSSSLYEHGSGGDACYWYFNQTMCMCTTYYRYDGFSVRAVQESTSNSKLQPIVSKVNNIESQIGDINTVLESIINGPKLITFTFKYSTSETIEEYQAEEGMTWEEWVNSKYNINGYVIHNDRVYDSTISYFIHVSLSEIITANREYFLIYYSGGSN